MEGRFEDLLRIRFKDVSLRTRSITSVRQGWHIRLTRSSVDLEPGSPGGPELAPVLETATVPERAQPVEQSVVSPDERRKFSRA